MNVWYGVTITEQSYENMKESEKRGPTNPVIYFVWVQIAAYCVLRIMFMQSILCYDIFGQFPIVATNGKIILWIMKYLFECLPEFAVQSEFLGPKADEYMRIEESRRKSNRIFFCIDQTIEERK